VSATGRGAKRRRNDFYGTPTHATDVFIRNADLPGGHWLEPCVADGQIIRAVNHVRKDIQWSYCEIRKECAPTLQRMCRRGDLGGEPHGCGVIGDYLTTPFLDRHYDVVITNPPFALAQEVIERSMELAPRALIVMLLRINFYESEHRNTWLRQYMPDSYVLANRPSFVRNWKTGKRGADATAYAWMVWHGAKKRRHGNVYLLPSVPRAERLLSERENYRDDLP
jgi:hypothetical protein